MKFAVTALAVVLAVAAAALFAKPAKAAVVDSLVYDNSPDWTVIVFGGTSMDSSTPGRTVLNTNNGRGIWFGNGSAYGDTPAWSLGSSAAGNYLSLDLSFSANAADWSAYLYDGSHQAAWQFNPTGCNDNCYGLPHQSGATFYYGDSSDPSQILSGFIALDTTQRHTFDWLLKNGQVSYRIDGAVVFSGAAYQVPFGGSLLVIGDGSGSTWSGEGSMTVWGNAADNAPAMAVLVPEPASWALMAGGVLGLAALRRRARPGTAGIAPLRSSSSSCPSASAGA